jgi:WD40 repeat protein
LLLALLAGVQWQRADEAGALAINRGATAQAASTDAIAQRSTAQAASTLAIQQAEALATSRAITEQEARLAGLREIATAALNQSETDPQLSLLLALYAIDQSDLEHRTLLPQVEGALHRAVQAADSRQRLSIDTMDYFILQVTFNAGGDHVVASGTETGGSEVTKVYDASSGELLANLPGRYATQTSWPDESNLVTLNQVPSPFVELTYWDTYVSEVLTTTVLSFPGEFTIQQYWANKFDPSGDYFALGSIGRGAGEWSDRITDTTVWNLRTEQVILNTDVEFDQGKTADPPITFAPDGQHLLMATLDDILIWTVESGAAPNTLIEQSRVFALEISPDGKLLATTSTPANTVILWDLAAVRELVTLPHTGAVVVVAYSPNGKLLATDCGGICIWDIDTSIEQGTGRLLFTLSGHGEGNYGFDFDPSGNLLVSVGPDSTIKVWDLTPGTGVEGSTFASAAATGETVRSSIALSPDGGRLAFANSSQDPLVWDTTNQQILFHLRAHNGPVEYIEYCPDGAYIATGGGDGKVMIWDGENGQLMLTLEGFSDGCCQLDFSPDGKSLAVGVSGAFSTIQVYELDALLEKAPEPVLTSSGDEKFTIYAHEGPISGMAFYPDNSNLTTCGIDGQVEHWDPETGGNLPSTIPSAETYTSFAYNQDGSLLALGDETGQLKLWDVKAAELLYTLSGHSEAINAIAYHPKGKRMATASDDGTLLIWDIEAGQGLFMLYEHEVSVTDLIFSPEGKYLYAVDSDGFVRTYLMEVDDLIALGLERLTRDFTEQECRQYLHLDQCPGGL